MPSYLYCSQCQSFTIEYDSKTGTAKCSGCSKEVKPEIRSF